MKSVSWYCNKKSMIDILYSTPPYEIETTKRKKKIRNKFIWFIYRLFWYVIAEPIVTCRWKQRLDGATRQTILLRGGNLNLWIWRDHCRSQQKKKSKWFIRVRRSKRLLHTWLRMRKVDDVVEYQKGKRWIVLGERKDFIFC